MLGPGRPAAGLSAARACPVTRHWQAPPGGSQVQLESSLALSPPGTPGSAGAAEITDDDHASKSGCH